jgi:hypothetical protein
MLQQESANLVDESGARMYQTVTHSVQRLQIELIIRLNRNETHVLTCHRLGDCLRILEIVFVGLDDCSRQRAWSDLKQLLRLQSNSGGL